MQPGYLHQQLPTEAPQQGEGWDAIMKDVQDKIVPGWSRPASAFRLRYLQTCYDATLAWH